MIYYRKFPGDYLRDTMALSMTEDGAYGRLLDHIYTTEKPIPSLEYAFRVCRVSNKNEKKAVEFVLTQFFYQCEGGHRHKRVDEELNHAESKRDKAKRSADARWSQCERNANASETQCSTDAIPDTRHQTPDKREEKPSSAPKNGAREIGSAEFQIFWDAYPRHEGRKPALKTWMRLNLDSRLGEVLAGLQAWKVNRDPAFMPYAQGWLNQESWKDTPTGGKQEQANGRTDNPKSFDALRNEGTDASLRRVAASYAGRVSPTRPALPAPVRRLGEPNIHPGTPGH